MVGSAKFLPRKISIFGGGPAINNDHSLMRWRGEEPKWILEKL
jgi:hypothetical protein